ncbi:MAG: hypothetical protein JWQ07_4028 [Ramlibacter sp.]|nr:hypothetical protein [Ramlibacter sp.]
MRLLQRITDWAAGSSRSTALPARQAAADGVDFNKSNANDEVLAKLAHQMRNSLGAIAAANNVLQAAAPGGGDAAEAQAIIERQTRTLGYLMNELLSRAGTQPQSPGQAGNGLAARLSTD